MDKMVPCFCGEKRIELYKAMLQLNGIPICSTECLRKAERDARKKSREKGFDVT